MCGNNGYYFKTKSAIWRVSGDKKHISFYAETKDCVGDTAWCREHCYIETKPLPIGFENIEAFYYLNDFNPEDIQDQNYWKFFTKAEFITFFASGSIDSLIKYGHKIDVNIIIETLSTWYPTKKFRFFIREKLSVTPRERIIKKNTFNLNAITIFSVDRDTKIKDIQYAIQSKAVKHISIVNHRDNEILLYYLKSKIKDIISCKKCNEDNYLCFKKKDKSLLIMEYQE